MATVTIPPAEVTVDMTPRMDFLIGDLDMAGITPILDAVSTQVLRVPNPFLNDSNAVPTTDIVAIRQKKPQNLFL